MMQDHYATLGIGRSASHTEIKRAYRKIALDKHPDKSPSPKDHEIFKEASAAYEVLSDQHKRKVYDLSLRPGVSAKKPKSYQERTHEATKVRPTLVTSLFEFYCLSTGDLVILEIDGHYYYAFYVHIMKNGLRMDHACFLMIDLSLQMRKIVSCQAPVSSLGLEGHLRLPAKNTKISSPDPEKDSCLYLRCRSAIRLGRQKMMVGQACNA